MPPVYAERGPGGNLQRRGEAGTGRICQTPEREELGHDKPAQRAGVRRRLRLGAVQERERDQHVGRPLHELDGVTGVAPALASIYRGADDAGDDRGG